MDPLILAATLPSPFLIADASALASLPREVRFLLRPLVAPRIHDSDAPPGGTLQQRILKGLEAGYSVLVLPDGPAGVAPSLSRFRLDAFHAALETSTAIQPIVVMGTSHVLDRGRQPGPRDEAKILVGDPLPVANTNGSVAGERERVREAIADLCRDS